MVEYWQLVGKRQYDDVGVVLDSAGVICEELRERFGDPIEAIEIAKRIIEHSSSFIGKQGRFVLTETVKRKFYFFRSREKTISFVEN